MKKNELRALLAVTVIAVPLVFTTGCGKKTEAPADTVVTEAVSTTPIPETIEETVEETIPDVTISEEEVLDESMAGTYYVISEDGIPAYGENDLGSEVVETIPYDTEVTVLGMSTETNLFKVQLTDSDDSTEADSLWVSSEFLDTVRGGYVPVDDESEAPSISEDPTAPTAENTSGLPSSFAGQEWYEALSPAEKAEVDEALNNSLNGVGGVDPNWADGTGSEQGNGESAIIDTTTTLGDGSGLTQGVIVE